MVCCLVGSFWVMVFFFCLFFCGNLGFFCGFRYLLAQKLLFITIIRGLRELLEVFFVGKDKKAY